MVFRNSDVFADMLMRHDPDLASDDYNTLKGGGSLEVS